ncbi:hypothetical protein LOD99_14474 [Oopsacas minuta]|uniref:Uncharacterized protein n=1 Tax=Oopsacas minuta TaxID=111878 RepID=A0AAV7KDN2_9METZ|nr:hypothetical protein LOD99_14451 [Oopsacas minuta]KAI6659551.1 hypothetical protein LOD99_14474 [Oopsacas minuta]
MSREFSKSQTSPPGYLPPENRGRASRCTYTTRKWGLEKTEETPAKRMKLEDFTVTESSESLPELPSSEEEFVHFHYPSWNYRVSDSKCGWTRESLFRWRKKPYKTLGPAPKFNVPYPTY